MKTSKISSHILFFIALLAMGWFGLCTPLLTVLFCYFTLDQLSVLKRRWLTLLAFGVVMVLFCTGIGYLMDQAFKNLPRIAMLAIPSVIHFAESKGFQLPFSDWDSLKALALDQVMGELHALGAVARNASKQLAFAILGVVVALSLYWNPSTDLKKNYAIRDNLYSAFWAEFAARFRSFYRSFKIVMKAQLTISTINTGLTSIFLLAVSMPHPTMLVLMTFLCGLLPIVGNLISNTVIVALGFTISVRMGLGALVFLVVLHKLEYFLNSKIVGDTIQNPVWLTLIGLIVGERLLGVPGMILAPVVLYYLKTEASQIQVKFGVPASAGQNQNSPEV